MTNNRFALVPYREVKYLNFDEVRRLIDACDTIPSFLKYKTAQRNRLLLETLWQTGCRVSEVVGGKMTADGKVVDQYPGIRDIDIDIRQARITIHVEKRSTPYTHTVGVEPTLIAELVDYSRTNSIGRQDRIFPITSRQVQHIIRIAAGAAGIQQDVTPHTLRHSYGMYLRQQGVDILTSQKAMGHANISSTMVYVQATDDDVQSKKSQIRWR